MQTAAFTKGQSVTGKGRHASTRYQVLTVHRDGTVTVRAMFEIDSDGRDRPGFLGFKYRCHADNLAPLPAKQAA